jgi:hypothetical protein
MIIFHRTREETACLTLYHNSPGTIRSHAAVRNRFRLGVLEPCPSEEVRNECHEVFWAAGLY